MIKTLLNMYQMSGTAEDAYVIFIEVVNKMAHKCKINGGTLTLTFVCIGQIF